MASGDKELCLHRLLFLQYQSRLQTFREIIGDGTDVLSKLGVGLGDYGGDGSSDSDADGDGQNTGEFRASEFLRFRSCDLLTAAKEYMRDENFSAVEVSFNFASFATFLMFTCSSSLSV